MKNVENLIESEYKDIMNESFSRFIGGVALAYALTSPLNQNIGNKTYELEAKNENADIKYLMRMVAERFPSKVNYYSFITKNPQESLDDFKNNNKELLNKPYNIYIENRGGNVIYHLLVGDEKIIKAFEDKYLNKK